MIDKSKREDGTFSREDFTFDKACDIYTCPAGKVLTTTGRIVNVEQSLYRVSKGNAPARVGGGIVTFEPGARTLAD